MLDGLASMVAAIVDVLVWTVIHVLVVTMALISGAAYSVGRMFAQKRPFATAAVAYQVWNGMVRCLHPGPPPRRRGVSLEDLRKQIESGALSADDAALDVYDHIRLGLRD